MCVDVDECSDDPCINGGICKNNVGSFTCTCAQGWEGETCSKGIINGIESYFYIGP